MSFAISGLAPRLNTELSAKVSEIYQPKVHDEQVGGQTVSAGLLSPQHADDWCGTVPHKFPFPVPPKGGDDGGWCGTVPRPFPGPIPPTPQPWLDLANAAQSFR